MKKQKEDSRVLEGVFSIDYSCHQLVLSTAHLNQGFMAAAKVAKIQISVP
jgi:hypothetical protein